MTKGHGKKSAMSPAPKVEPVALNDYYSDYKSNDSPDLTMYEDGWTDIALRKKKSIRAQGKMKDFELEGFMKLRKVAMTHEK